MQINRVLHVKIISGPCAGQLAFIPRIKLISSQYLPFELHRVQFPVQLAFAMTTNKSQGQSLATVGLYLQNPVFGHGQFYMGIMIVTTYQLQASGPTPLQLHDIPNAILHGLHIRILSLVCCVPDQVPVPVLRIRNHCLSLSLDPICSSIPVLLRSHPCILLISINMCYFLYVSPSSNIDQVTL